MNLEEIEKRLKRLEDIEEIRQLHVHYVNSLTLADWDAVIDCFAPDSEVDFGNRSARGKAQIDRLFREQISEMHVGLEGNFVVHPIVSVEGDRATGSWLLYIQFCRPRDLPSDMKAIMGEEMPDWMQGFYDMEYVRIGGRWKIRRLSWRRRLLSPRPSAERTPG
jgi:ketosteroid isomerase-like protein